jgi:hypothetical protein
MDEVSQKAAFIAEFLKGHQAKVGQNKAYESPYNNMIISLSRAGLASADP